MPKTYTPEQAEARRAARQQAQLAGHRLYRHYLTAILTARLTREQLEADLATLVENHHITGKQLSDRLFAWNTAKHSVARAVSVRPEQVEDGLDEQRRQAAARVLSHWEWLSAQDAEHWASPDKHLVPELRITARLLRALGGLR